METRPLPPRWDAEREAGLWTAMSSVFKGFNGALPDELPFIFHDSPMADLYYRDLAARKKAELERRKRKSACCYHVSRNISYPMSWLETCTNPTLFSIGDVTFNPEEPPWQRQSSTLNTPAWREMDFSFTRADRFAARKSSKSSRRRSRKRPSTRRSSSSR